ncbi:hypothetical protein SAY87_021880 [Trapa incisa]|uniref:Uncharacterized protein n=1 Tax=Trapa incisa TaxID=236973 RepID=A0AAN7JTX9_9MYRT|nr:hypothetical protein SAY87_021880 [Trapa incisa]
MEFDHPKATSSEFGQDLMVDNSGEGFPEAPTSSRSVIETVNGRHKFFIQGYPLAKCVGIGKHIVVTTSPSPGFTGQSISIPIEIIERILLCTSPSSLPLLARERMLGLSSM